MLDKECLARLASESRAPAPENLPDLRELSVRGDDPRARLEDLVEKAGNPYRFRVGGTTVCVSFSGEGTLASHLAAYFSGQKAGGPPAGG